MIEIIVQSRRQTVDGYAFSALKNGLLWKYIENYQMFSVTLTFAPWPWKPNQFMTWL